MTKLALLAVALAFPSADMLDARGNVDDIHSLTADDTEQRVLVMQGYFESMWGKFVLGDCKCADGKGGGTNDCPDLTQRHVSNCNAFGVMQTWQPAKWVDGATPERLIANRRLGYEVGLTIYRWAFKRCGTVRGALGLMFTGKACGWASDKVAKRCKWVGC